ncbi:MAG: aspartyl protease family protein [Candidatus Melainabacteria bacterium]|nr:aspartyl protease family protein [Candidatus Melainabacteria bacterium]
MRILVALISALAISAQPILHAGSISLAQEQPELQLDEVMVKALNAYGGAAALERVENSSVTYGKFYPARAGAANSEKHNEEDALQYRKFRQSSKWRVDLDGGSGDASSKRVLAYNGYSGWRLNDNQAQDMQASRLTALNDDNERQPTIICHWKQAGYDFTLDGRTSFRQIPVFAIKLSYGKEGRERPTTLFLDQRNFLIVGITYDSSATESVSTEYSEYRPVAGTILPFQQTKYINQKPASDLIVNNITVGENIDEALFDRPQVAGALRLDRDITVKFDYAQKEILVKCRIDNGSEDLWFLFDTGASDTIVDRRTAADYYLFKDGKAQMLSASGSVNVENSAIKRFEIGSLILNNVDARIHSLAGQSQQLGRPLAGIIGTNVIEKFVTKIDYGKCTLTFIDSDKFKAPANAAVIPLTEHNIPVVRAKLNGIIDQPMLADTGAAFNNLPSAVAKKLLAATGQDKEKPSHMTEGTGLDGKPIKLANMTVKKVGLQTQTLSNVPFTYIYDANAKASSNNERIEKQGGFFRSTGLGILGNPFFQNYITYVDYKFQRILLEPNPIVRIREQINAQVDIGDKKLLIYRDYRLAEAAYQKAMGIATANKDQRSEAMLWGRLANARRLMAKELTRPEHAKIAYANFVKAQELAKEVGAKDVEGRILSDWSLLYSDNGQPNEANRTINSALLLAPQDAQVNVNYAVHQYRNNQFAGMQKYIEKALFLEPSNWQGLWYQFKLQEKFLDYPRAVKTLKEIIKYYPWSTLATKKLAEIEETMKPNASLTPKSGAGTATPVPGN